MLETNVCIIGAGPAGSAAALKLSTLGETCLIVDKAIFPRDKICGDAISAKSLFWLDKVHPKLRSEFEKQTFNTNVKGVRFQTINHVEVDVVNTYQTDRDTTVGYVSSRWDFDNFLAQQIKKDSNITFLEGQLISDYEYINHHWIISNEDKSVTIKSKLLIDASGTYSSFARKFANIKKISNHYIGAVRAYYKGVSGLDRENNLIELHGIKDLLPGYFWVFPLNNGLANVGLGMRMDYVKKKGINLREKFQSILESPAYKSRFEDAEPIGKLQGFGIPLGSKRYPLFGDGYLLTGDAGYLVNPLSGEGIANALLSGVLAAQQAKECVNSKDYSKSALQNYQKAINEKLGKSLKLSYQLQQLFKYPLTSVLAEKVILSNPKNIPSLLLRFNKLVQFWKSLL
jgi:geranylgeranyl reductase family protein